MPKMLTPCYLIDTDCFKSNLSLFREAFSKKWNGIVEFGYSIKTNHNQYFLDLAKECNMYAEAVSDDEYEASLLAGYTPNKIIFNGPQKSKKLLLYTLQNGGIVNLDNEEDIKAVILFCMNGTKIKADIGLRVNFDLEDKCRGETTAGNQVSRFGFCVENGEFKNAINQLHNLGVPISGLHMHYSTKTRSKNIFKELAHQAVNLILENNLQQEIRFIDMGGGFFLGNNAFSKGKPSLTEYAFVIVNELKKVLDTTNVTLVIEPGASLLSTAVEYHTTIINERLIRGTKILTVDGSNLHINPFMINRDSVYEKKYTSIRDRKIITNQIICGSTCMEDDRISFLNNQKELLKDDILIYKNAGAYTMGFNNCFINLPPYIYAKVDNGIKLIREKNKKLLLEI